MYFHWVLFVRINRDPSVTNFLCCTGNFLWASRNFSSWPSCHLSQLIFLMAVLQFNSNFSEAHEMFSERHQILTSVLTRRPTFCHLSQTRWSTFHKGNLFSAIFTPQLVGEAQELKSFGDSKSWFLEAQLSLQTRAGCATSCVNGVKTWRSAFCAEANRTIDPQYKIGPDPRLLNAIEAGFTGRKLEINWPMRSLLTVHLHL